LVHPGSSDVTKSETRTPTGLVINHLKCGVLVAITVAIMQNAASNPFQPPKRSAPRIESNTGAIVMMTTASSNQTSHPAFTSQTSMRFFGAADQHSLYFLANWRKGGVQRSGIFGELIPDACDRRGPSIQFELQNGRLTGDRKLRRARCRSTWSKIGAAQHPGIEQRAIFPSCCLILRFWRFVG
jgi:hypothetical protein